MRRGRRRRRGRPFGPKFGEGTFPTSSPRGAVLRIRSEHSVSNLQSALTSITIRIPQCQGLILLRAPLEHMELVAMILF